VNRYRVFLKGDKQSETIQAHFRHIDVDANNRQEAQVRLVLSGEVQKDDIVRVVLLGGWE
jgi:hypothetical protein